MFLQVIQKHTSHNSLCFQELRAGLILAQCLQRGFPLLCLLMYVAVVLIFSLCFAQTTTSHLPPSVPLYIFVTGMAPEVWIPPFCRPQNVSAALCSSNAVCYRCHAAPLWSQCHRDTGQQHYRVSHAHFNCLKMTNYGI